MWKTKNTASTFIKTLACCEMPFILHKNRSYKWGRSDMWLTTCDCGVLPQITLHGSIQYDPKLMTEPINSLAECLQRSRQNAVFSSSSIFYKTGNPLATTAFAICWPTDRMQVYSTFALASFIWPILWFGHWQIFRLPR